MEQVTTALESGVTAGQLFGTILGIVLLFGIPALLVVSLIRAVITKSKIWIGLAVLTGLLTIGLFVAAVYAVMQGALADAKRASQPHVYHTSDQLAAITGPGSWRRLSLDSTDASLQVGNLYREEYLVIISEPRADFGEDFTCAEFANAAAQISAEEIEDAKISAPSPIDLNGMEAYQTQISGIVDAVEIDYFNTYVKGREHFHQILTWTLSSNRETAFPRFRQVVDTFHELPKK